MKAVVVNEIDSFGVTDVELDAPKAGEVLVKMKATGVCHSDLSIANGTIPAPLPTVLGHEGAGIVEQVGEGVTNVVPGDHVAISFIPSCGSCFHCLRQESFLCNVAKQDGNLFDGTTRVHQNGTDIFVMSFVGLMAEYAVVPSACVISIDKEFDFKAAALVGCGVSTGVGAVIKTAEVPVGATVAVFGCGGVGLNVVQGARLAGAGKIIAVDLSTEKMEMAREFGATDTIDPSGDAVKQIFEMTGGMGVDYAFEVVGSGKLVEQCIKATRKGGNIVVVGVGRLDDKFSIRQPIMVFTAKTLMGSMYGGVNFKTDFPMYLDLYRQGRLDLDSLVSKTYTLDEAMAAFEDLEKGQNARGVIVHS
ncbi:MAG: S-(hydroxymethyl)glutathione dehydrogenase/alcohol dehydrogenase [Gammaproteobacteria bacterium]|jgi:S-(hydroxymethyl)glutathione dehydrogenase/alcohol dehydrogenase